MSDGNVTHPDRIEWLAERIEPYVTIYARTCGLSLPLNLDSAIADMITDLLVFAWQRDLDPQSLVERAVVNFNSVLEEEGVEEYPTIEVKQ